MRWLAFGWVSACAPHAASPAAPSAADPSWVAEAVAEALAWELQPGTSAPEDADPAARGAELRTFFLAHPEYADPEHRRGLADHACGLDGTESAHEWLTHPKPPEPLVVEVTADDWRVFVAYSDTFCTSDDWGFYANELGEVAVNHGAVAAYAGPVNDVVVVHKGGVEVARAPLTSPGFLVWRAGGLPTEVEYAPTPDVVPALEAAFGPAPAPR